MENLLIVAKRQAKVVDLADARDFVPVYNGVANATLANAKSVQFLAKKTNGKIVSSVPIPFEAITSITLQEYKAPVMPVLRIGNNAAASTAIQVTTTGEGIIVVNNRSYSRVGKGLRKSVSRIKTAAQTPLQFLTLLVADLNSMTVEEGKFFTAQLVDLGGNQHITITSLDRNADIDIQCDGMFAGTQIVKVTPGFIGLGVGEDVVEMEEDYTKNSGNAGYMERNELWYKEEIEAKKTEKYAGLTINWKGSTVVGSATENTGNNTFTLFAEVLSVLPVDIFAAVPGCPVLEIEQTT